MRDLSAQAFHEAISQPGVQVVDFWAPWCGPCRAMAPQLERAQQLRPDVAFGKVNVDDEPELAGSLGVLGIPTLVAFQDGAEVARQVGTVSAEALVAALPPVSA
jgi:thioredoxin